MPPDAFSGDRKRGDGLATRCKTCKREASRLWYERRKSGGPGAGRAEREAPAGKVCPECGKWLPLAKFLGMVGTVGRVCRACNWAETLRRRRQRKEVGQQRPARRRLTRPERVARALAGYRVEIGACEGAVAELRRRGRLDARGRRRLVAAMWDLVRARGRVERLEAVGKSFDPWEHEAVLYEETPGAAEGTVVEEFRPGYKLYDRVIRPAQVKVAKHTG